MQSFRACLPAPALRALLISTSAMALGASPGFAQSAAQSTAQSAAQAAAGSETRELEEIVVQGINLARKRALEAKKDADAIVDAVSADDLGRLPDKNAAEAVKRVPGVNITQDQGEGRYVSIRGASPSLNSVTLNGLAVGTVEENSRRVPFDVLGGELLSSIEVVKAVTPDLEANAIGGYINVKTPSAYDFKGRFFGRGSARIGDDEYGGYNPYAADLTTGGKFGSDESLAVLLGVSYRDRHYLTNGLYADDWKTVPGLARTVPESHKFNNYDLDRERLTLTGNIELKPDAGSLYYLRALYTDAQESEIRYRNRNYFARITTPQPARFSINADGLSGTYTNQRLRLELRAEDKSRIIGNYAVGGENKFDGLEIDYAASLVRNSTHEPNQNWVFQAPDSFSSGTYDLGPGLFVVRPNVAGILANVRNIPLNAYTTQDLRAKDRGAQGVFNAKYKWEGDSYTAFLKAGALYRSMKKDQNIDSTNYVLGSGGTSAFNAGLPGLLDGPLLEGDVQGTLYEVGPRLSLQGLRDFTQSNLANAAALRRDATATLQGSVLSDFTTEEDIYALYLMGTVTLGEWTLLAGGRYEHTDVSGRAYDLLNGTTVSAVDRSGSYGDFLPAVHVNYRSAALPLVLRAAWTNTIGRPEYTDITARRVISRLVDPATGLADGTISQGNPDLKSYESRNFDLSAEYYLPNNGILSAAGFYKDVDGFIFNEVVSATNVTVDGLLYDRLVTTTPRNANKGKIRGVEFAYQQQFAFLPGPFDGLGFQGSMTIVDSSIAVAGRPDKLPFLGQADRVYSLTGFYQYGPFEAALSYDWADDILVAIGANADGDFYDRHYGRLDFKANYRVTENITLFLELLNLNDEPLGEFQGNPDQITRREMYGRQGFAGVSVRW